MYEDGIPKLPHHTWHLLHICYSSPSCNSSLSSAVPQTTTNDSKPPREKRNRGTNTKRVSRCSRQQPLCHLELRYSPLCLHGLPDPKQGRLYHSLVPPHLASLDVSHFVRISSSWAAVSGSCCHHLMSLASKRRFGSFIPPDILSVLLRCRIFPLASLVHSLHAPELTFDSWALATTDRLVPYLE